VSATPRWLAGGAERPPLWPPGAERLPPARAPDSLPYRVELWDFDKTGVEAVLALTSNGTIGYAAFYAALAEYPDRRITLSLDGRLLTQAGGPAS
jgi:hypothetical protein